MIISSKFFLLHIPKTGGSAVQNAFLKIFDNHPEILAVLPGYKLVPNGKGYVAIAKRGEPMTRPRSIALDWREGARGQLVTKHANAHELRGFVSTPTYEAMNQIAVVRNPFARSFSA